MVLAQQRAGFSQAETSAVVFREQQGQTPFTPEQRLIQYDHQAWARALTEPVQRRLRNIDCGHSPKPRLSVAFPRKLTFVDHALAIVTGLPGPAPDGKDREGGQGLP